jgi:hypothetical protein
VTPPPDLIEPFVRPLERAAAEYMTTGRVAAVIYGVEKTCSILRG